MTKLLRNFVVKGCGSLIGVVRDITVAKLLQVCMIGLLYITKLLRNFVVKVSEIFITKSFVRCELITKSSADRSGLRRQWWHY